MRRAGIIAAGAVGALAVAAATAWLLAFRDTAVPVGVDEAVETFRGETTEGGSPIREGVYVYATVGHEKTDALIGVTHRYPRRSTITVTAAECGFRLTWRVLKGRSTEWTYCVSADGWALRSQDERHTFFGRTERTTYLCEDTSVRPRELEIGDSWQVSCSTDDTRETGTVNVVEQREWSLDDGPTITETLIRKATSFTGANRGTARHDLWFDDKTGMPTHLRMVSRTTSDSPIGDVAYEEDVTLTLLSLEPRR